MVEGGVWLGSEESMSRGRGYEEEKGRITRKLT